MRDIIVSISAILLIIGFYLKFNSSNERLQSIISMQRAANDTALVYVDMYNSEHRQLELSRGKLKDIEKFSGLLLDSISKRVGVKKKRIKFASEITAKVFDSATVRIDTVLVRDTVFGLGYRFNWSDDYTTMKGFLTAEKDSSGFKRANILYTIKVPVIVSVHWKRKWFLGKKRYFVDAYSENTKAKIIGLSGYKIN